MQLDNPVCVERLGFMGIHHQPGDVGEFPEIDFNRNSSFHHFNEFRLIRMKFNKIQYLSKRSCDSLKRNVSRSIEKLRSNRIKLENI